MPATGVANITTDAKPSTKKPFLKLSAMFMMISDLSLLSLEPSLLYEQIIHSSQMKKIGVRIYPRCNIA
jgi:hypothetical protein